MFANFWKGRARIVGLALASALFLLATLCVMAGVAFRESRGLALANGAHELRQVVASVSGSVGRALDDIRNVQLTLAGHIRGLGLTAGSEFVYLLSDRDTRLLLEREIAGWSHIKGAALVDYQGRILSATPAWPILGDEFAKKRFFNELRGGPESDFVISVPKYSLIEKTWSIILGQRILSERGDFLGAVAVAIPLEHFSQILERLPKPFGSSIAVYEGNGAQIARSPHVGAPPVVGRAAPNNAVVSGPPAAGSTNDRTVVMETIARYGLLVVVDAEVGSILSGWRRQVAYLAIMGLVAMVIIGAGLFHVGRLLWRSAPVTSQALGNSAGEKVACAALDRLPFGISVFDSELRLVMSNKRYADMYKFSPAQVARGTTLEKIIDYHIAGNTHDGSSAEEYRHKAMEAALARVASARVLSGRPGAATATLEEPWSVRYSRKLGNGRMVETANFPMPDCGWVAIHEDVTEHRSLKEEYDRSLELISNIVEAVPLTLFVKDARTLRYLLINQAGETRFERPRSHIIGKRAEDLFSKAQADVITAEDREFLASEEKRLVCERPRSVLNRERLHRLTRVKVGWHGGEVKYLLGVVEDVTEASAKEAPQVVRRSA
jgi:PAS domain-containing protein